MDISCSSCRKQFSIPDDQIVSYTQDIEIDCPECQENILVDYKKTQEELYRRYKSLPFGEELKHNILTTLESLPPMPQVAIQAQAIVENPDSNFTDLAKIIEQDPAIAVQVIKFANSATYSTQEKVTNVQQAAVTLGTKVLHELLTLACTSKLLRKTLPGYNQESTDIWQHSLSVAAAARHIAQLSKPALADDAFSAGLIHDAGKLILDPHLEKRIGLVVKYSTKDSIKPFLEAEKIILGFDHAEMAAAACEKWNMPEKLIDAVRYHHNPQDAKEKDLTIIVHLADAIAILSGLGSGVDGLLYEFDDSTLKTLNITVDQMNEIMLSASDYAIEIAQHY